jgi:hypothetical protein
MRNVKCFDLHGITVEDVLNEFNERRGEFKVHKGDIISMSTRTPVEPVTIATKSGSEKSTVIVTIFYWTDEE